MSLFNLVSVLFLVTPMFFTACEEVEKGDDTPTITEIDPHYVAGDFHQHSTFTDGSWSFGHVMSKNNEYDLDWWANSEHGGYRERDGRKSGTDLGTTVYWDEESDVTISGDYKTQGNHQAMWRWQIIKEYSFPEVLKARGTFFTKSIIQGLEWNVPGHEHASTAIITNQFLSAPNADPMAEFEYKFDGSDTDTQGGANNWTKSAVDGHEKTIEAITWMENNYKNTSYVVPAHPERKGLYSISDFRDMNNAGPSVCFGFESMPGHQKSSNRGGYSSSADGGGTYGGCGVYAAKVGGLWDALLSEGRKFWLFANSDFHNIDGDFYPGEYQKTYTYVSDLNDAQSIIDGLRSGNSFVVSGDLIDALDFTVEGQTMGQTAYISGNSTTISILVHDPSTPNNNTYSSYTNPELDHIDIIAGKVKGIITPGSADYSVDDVTSTTSVIARFDATGGTIDSNGIESKKWEDLGDGWKKISFKYSEISSDMYFRLRGSNFGLNVSMQTDEAGNPLADDLNSPNDASKAFDDLWFYSNPIFVKN